MQDRFKFNRFEEFLSVKEGEVMVSIEHWYNPHLLLNNGYIV